MLYILWASLVYAFKKVIFLKIFKWYLIEILPIVKAVSPAKFLSFGSAPLFNNFSTI